MAKRPDESGLSDTTSEAERFDPTRDGPDLAYEHIHRYELARRAVSNLAVLDLAAGSGFGSAVLEASAASVTSLDLDPRPLGGRPSAVCGDGMRLPFADGSFDAVVCFEAIEHVDDPARLVSEVRRVLRGPSIFIVSTPDRAIYTDRAGHDNAYHVSEMDRDEFRTLLRRKFSSCRILGQGLWAGSWIAKTTRVRNAPDLGRRSVEALRLEATSNSVGQNAASWSAPEADQLPMPVYLIALCADSASGRAHLMQTVPEDSVLHDPRQWLLGQYERLTQNWGDELDAFRAQLDAARREHADQAAQIVQAREAIAGYERDSRQVRLEVAELEASRTRFDAMRAELEEARGYASGLAEEIDRARRVIDAQAAEVGSARTTIDAQVAELEAARASIDGQTQELATLRALIDERDREVEVARAALATRDTEVISARSVIESRGADISAARDALAARDAELDAARAAIDGLASEVEGARTALSERDAEIASARGLIDRFEQEISRARDDAGERARALRISEEKCESLCKELEANRASALAARAEREDYIQRIRGMEIEIEGVLVAFGEITRSYEELVAGLDAREAGERLLAAQIEDARDVIRDKQSEISSAQDVIAAKHTALGEAGQAIAGMEGELESARVVIDAMTREIADAARAADATGLELNSARQRFAELGQELNRGSETIEGMALELSEAGRVARGARAELDAARETIESQDRQIERARRELERKQTEIVAAAGTIQALERGQSKRLVRLALRITRIKDRLLGWNQ